MSSVELALSVLIHRSFAESKICMRLNHLQLNRVTYVLFISSRDRMIYPCTAAENDGSHGRARSLIEVLGNA